MNKPFAILLTALATGCVTAARAQLVINEVAPAGTALADETGEFEDWLELYNAGETVVDLTGYYVSDDVDEPRKWRLPPGLRVLPKGYLLLWADGDPGEGPAHLDFSLKKGGESVVISGPDGSVIQGLDFPAVPWHASYARDADGDYGIVGEPSPGAANPAGKTYLRAPAASLREGGHVGPQTVTLASEVAGATIYYTLDGSVPTVASAVYTGALQLTGPTAIRAFATAPGYAASQVETYTYLIDVLPARGMTAMMVTTDPRNLFDDSTGIYVRGTNGAVQYCAFDGQPANYFQDWERPANFQLITDDGRVAFDVDAETSIGGTCSRTFPVKTLNLSLKEKTYGDGAIEYPVFPQRGKIEYERLRIRNGGQDWSRTLMRDMVNQNLLFGYMDVDVQLGRPTAVYLNGGFWGVQNLRERLRPQYFEQLFGVDEDDLALIKSPGLPYAYARTSPKGLTDLETLGLYDELYRWVETADLRRDADAERFAAEVDVNEMLNYWTTMLYLNGRDWPANNLFVWKERGNPASKWRYVVDDTDLSSGSTLATAGETQYDYDNVAFALKPDCEGTASCDRRATLLLRKVLERPEWRAEFLQRANTLAATAYEPARATAYIDSIAALIEPYVTPQFKVHPTSWGGWDGAFPTWVAELKEFYRLRAPAFRGFLAEAYGVGETYDLTLGTDASTDGRVLIHSEGRVLPEGYTAPYFTGVPLELTARADEGYVFERWLETGVTDSVIAYVGSADVTLTPVFARVSGVGAAFAKTSLTLAPNPTSGRVRITDAAPAAGARYRVVDLLGRELLNVAATGTTTELDLTGLLAGTYIVRGSGGGGVRVVRGD